MPQVPITTGMRLTQTGELFNDKELNLAGLGIRSFQKNVPFFMFFCVLYKRTFRSLRSFEFFIKERSVLCVLLRSL